MNEPKRRGRPPKAKPCADCGQVDGHYDDCPVAMGVSIAADVLSLKADIEADLLNRIAAQAYADRVWAGQSPSADLPWRVERVRLALEGQGLPFEGVVLP